MAAPARLPRAIWLLGFVSADPFILASVELVDEQPLDRMDALEARDDLAHRLLWHDRAAHHLEDHDAAVAAAVRAAMVEGPRSRPISLHVRADNAPALTAYRAAGFVDREPWRLAVRS